MTYLDHHERANVTGHHGFTSAITHSWTDHTRLNLAQHYDAARVDAIMAGRDPKTQMDLARWAQLGQRSAA